VALPVERIVGEPRPVAVGVDQIFALAVGRVAGGDLRLLVDRDAGRAADLEELAGGVVDVLRHPVGRRRAGTDGKTGIGARRRRRGQVHPHRRADQPAVGVVAILRQAGQGAAGPELPLLDPVADRVIGEIGAGLDGEAGPGRGRDALRRPARQNPLLDPLQQAVRAPGVASRRMSERAGRIGIGGDLARQAAERIVAQAGGVLGGGERRQRRQRGGKGQPPMPTRSTHRATPRSGEGEQQEAGPRSIGVAAGSEEVRAPPLAPGACHPRPALYGGGATGG
jgi:hypothetical protein